MNLYLGDCHYHHYYGFHYHYKRHFHYSYRHHGHDHYHHHYHYTETTDTATTCNEGTALKQIKWWMSAYHVPVFARMVLKLITL